MSKKNTPPTESAEVPEAQTPVESPAGAEAAPAAPPAPEDELAALRREVEALRDKNLRALAEVQNAQKRAQREKEEALRYAEADFARELLVILDDFARTSESARTATDVQAVAEGVRIVHEHFLKVLRSRGIEPIEAVGKPFDPAFHQALMQRPSDDHPAGTVIEEAARGYKMHDRVLRPSRVIVSSGAVPAETAGEQS
ncbi:MAG: nucleotide exchange factor GrpE [Planctomycetota bacterium]